MDQEVKTCTEYEGTLPSCAPLGIGYIPMQGDNPPKYCESEGLTRGTLFPGLDLPLKNIPNDSHPYAGTPLGELMALDFMLKELNLYLDTHPKDQEAWKAFQEAGRLYCEGKQTFQKKYGPITVMEAAEGKAYTWLQEPWPWERMD